MKSKIFIILFLVIPLLSKAQLTNESSGIVGDWGFSMNDGKFYEKTEGAPNHTWTIVSGSDDYKNGTLHINLASSNNSLLIFGNTNNQTVSCNLNVRLVTCLHTGGTITFAGDATVDQFQFESNNVHVTGHITGGIIIPVNISNIEIKSITDNSSSSVIKSPLVITGSPSDITTIADLYFTNNGSLNTTNGATVNVTIKTLSTNTLSSGISNSSSNAFTSIIFSGSETGPLSIDLSGKTIKNGISFNQTGYDVDIAGNVTLNGATVVNCSGKSVNIEQITQSSSSDSFTLTNGTVTIDGSSLTSTLYNLSLNGGSLSTANSALINVNGLDVASAYAGAKNTINNLTLTDTDAVDAELSISGNLSSSGTARIDGITLTGSKTATVSSGTLTIGDGTSATTSYVRGLNVAASSVLHIASNTTVEHNAIPNFTINGNVTYEDLSSVFKISDGIGTTSTVNNYVPTTVGTLHINTANEIYLSSSDLYINANKKIIFGGGTNTYGFDVHVESDAPTSGLFVNTSGAATFDSLFVANDYVFNNVAGYVQVTDFIIEADGHVDVRTAGAGAGGAQVNATNSLVMKAAYDASSSSGMIIGQYLVCSAMEKQESYRSYNTGGKANNGDFWREVYQPFNSETSLVSTVDWSHDNTNLGGTNPSTLKTRITNVYNYNGVAGDGTNPKEYYISRWNASTQQWQLPTPSTKSYGAWQIWVEGDTQDHLSIHNATYANANSTAYSLVYDVGNATNWNFLGNPFTANFNLYNELSSGGSLNGKVQGNTAYILTHYGGGSVGYRTIVGDDTGDYGSQIIPQIQAFWVNATVSAPTSNYSSSNWVTTDGGILQKTNNTSANSLKIEFTESDLVHDYLLLKFTENQLFNDNGLSIADAYALNLSTDASPNGYVKRGNNFLIHKEYTLNDLDNNFSENYYLMANRSVNLKMQISQNSLNTNKEVFVYDRKENKTHNLSQSAYEFTHDPNYSQASASRFEISIVNQSLSESDLELDNIKFINRHSEIEFLIPADINVESINIISVSGVELINSKSNKIDISRIPSGVYIALVNTDQGSRKSIKFVKQ